MTFAEVREYQYGDDVRDIDWNVTARHNHPYIKVYEEERELTVMLLIDVSRSEQFGATGEVKREKIAEIAATIAFSAIQNNDKIGVIFFTNKIEKFIPPQKGRKHILYIISQLLDFQPENSETDIPFVLKFFTDALKKRCTTFLISDFIDNHDLYKSLSIASNKHDVIGVQVYDKRDTALPDVGLIKVTDMETGKSNWLDTSSSSIRKSYSKYWYDRQQKITDVMMRCKVDMVSIATDEDYVKALMMLFKNRGVR